MPKGLLAKIGGMLSLLSITFLPVGGCGGAGVTGFEILTASDIPVLIKLLLAISVSCAFVAMLAKFYAILFACGGVGAGGLLWSYIIVRHGGLPINLKIGAYLALIGFGLIAIEGFLQMQNVTEEKNSGDKNDPSAPT